jgi:hypothetical protein
MVIILKPIGTLKVIKEGVAWDKVIGFWFLVFGFFAKLKFVILAKYLFVKHLGHELISCHKVNKSNISFIQRERPRHKDHASMNACILSNPLAKFH